jgi:hypothetical protein
MIIRDHPERTICQFDGVDMVDESFDDKIYQGAIKCPACGMEVTNVTSYPAFTVYYHPCLESFVRYNDYCIVNTYQETLEEPYMRYRLSILGPYSILEDNGTWESYNE